MVVANRLKRLSLPMESLPYRGTGRSWAMRDTPNLPGVERKSKHERRKEEVKKIFGILLALALVLSFSLVAVPAVEANDTASSTMIFEGDLTPQDGGVYTGTIDMTEGGYYVSGGAGESISTGGGFDVYAKEGGTAYVEGMSPATWTIGSDHDAYSESGPWGTWYDPDCADWNNYSLELTADHWYLRYTATGESPMSGVMYWYGDGTGYAAETDPGTLKVDHGGTSTDPTEYTAGSAQEWGWHCGWGEERIPLELPGFAVEVTPGSYTVTLTPDEGPVRNIDTGLSYGTIQLAITAPETLDNHTIEVDVGTYVEVGQIVISKNLTMVGEDKETTIVKPAQNTGSSGDARGWFLVQDGKEFNLSNVTLDGEGKNVHQAIRSFGRGTIDNNIIKNISYNIYTGLGVVVMGNYDMTFSNNTFTDIQRIGMMAFGSGVTNAEITGNTYTGKGVDDWLDYGIEIGGGAIATITGNTITNCKGVASSDNSTSAGILVTTYFGAGTTATITGNTLTDNTGGIGVGYDEYDTSTVVAHYNNINGNTDYGIDTTAPVVDARYNWWGDASGPSGEGSGTGDAISENILYSPWLGAEVGTEPMTWGVDPTGLIQDAVDEADSGDTIMVKAGTYNESVTVNKSLTLEGANAGIPATEVRGPESIIDAQLADYGVFIIEATTTATLDGFTVRNYEVGGILAGAFSPPEDDPFAVHILNNVVEEPSSLEDAHNNNIQVGDGTTGTIIGNEVSGALLESPDWSGSGIIVAGSSDVLVSDNYVHNCEGGIQIVGYAEYREAPAENNIIEYNLVEDNESGIVPQMNSIGTIIRYNDVLNNDEGIAVMAIDYSWEHSTPSGTQIHYNNIVGNVNYGVESGVWGNHSGTVTAEEVDATYNWWGANDGPSDGAGVTDPVTGEPADGSGDKVTANVHFDPWLLEVPTVTTQAATEVKFIMATVNMNYTVGGYSPVQVRFAYKKSTDTEWSYTAWASKSVDGTHAQLLRVIDFGARYDFKAQLKYDDIVDGETVIEGDILQFTTSPVEGCFIATAAYGTPSAEQIDVLREFRDTVLLESTVGSQFVALYYQLSPPVAEFIAGNELLRTMVRELLVDPIVGVVEATGNMWRN